MTPATRRPPRARRSRLTFGPSEQPAEDPVAPVCQPSFATAKSERRSRDVRPYRNASRWRCMGSVPSGGRPERKDERPGDTHTRGMG